MEQPRLTVYGIRWEHWSYNGLRVTELIERSFSWRHGWDRVCVSESYLMHSFEIDGMSYLAHFNSGRVKVALTTKNKPEPCHCQVTFNERHSPHRRRPRNVSKELAVCVCRRTIFSQGKSANEDIWMKDVRSSVCLSTSVRPVKEWTMTKQRTTTVPEDEILKHLCSLSSVFCSSINVGN